MSTPVVCNPLVPGSSRSCSGLFVDLRDHYCQDTAAEISVRSVGFTERRLLRVIIYLTDRCMVLL